MKKTQGIARQYTEQQKLGYSNAQSISYFSVPQGTPVFGWTKERSSRLLGVAGVDMLPNRLFIYDGGTVNRPYDGDDLTSRKEYIKRKTISEEVIIFDISGLDGFKQKIESIGSKQYNEILGRITWDIDQTSICVFSDNQETRWIAINWAEKFKKKIQKKSLDLYSNGEISDEQYTKFKGYEPKISYYDPATQITGYYAEDQIKTDIKLANDLYENPVERQRNYSNGDFEFLLMIDNIEKISEILTDEVLMKKIMGERLYIAEDLIQKYHSKSKNPVVVNNQNLYFKNITPSLLEKLNTGMLTGFKTGPDGRILLWGLTISDKDLSNMDLTKFNFNNCTLDACVLKNVNLKIGPNEDVTFKNCDLRGTTLKQCDFSNVTLSGYYLCDNIEPFDRIWKSAQNFNLHFDNFSMVEIINFFKKEKTQFKDMLGVLFTYSLKKNYSELSMLLLEENPQLSLPITDGYERGHNALTLMIEHERLEVAEFIMKLYPESASHIITDNPFYKGHNAFTLAVKKDNFELAKLIMERHPKSAESALHVITDGYQKGHNAFTLAVRDENFELAKLIIERHPESIFHPITDGYHEGHNALTLAVSNKNVELAKLIMERHPKSAESALHVITDGYQKGHNAFTLAVRDENFELAKLIIERHPESALYVITDGDNKGHNAFTLAIKYNNFDLAKLIIERHPESASHIITDNFFDKGHNALTLAILGENIELCKMIIKITPASLKHIITAEGGYKNLTPLMLAENLAEKNPALKELILSYQKPVTFLPLLCAQNDAVIKKRKNEEEDDRPTKRLCIEETELLNKRKYEDDGKGKNKNGWKKRRIGSSSGSQND